MSKDYTELLVLAVVAVLCMLMTFLIVQYSLWALICPLFVLSLVNGMLPVMIAVKLIKILFKDNE